MISSLAMVCGIYLIVFMLISWSVPRRGIHFCEETAKSHYVLHLKIMPTFRSQLTKVAHDDLHVNLPCFYYRQWFCSYTICVEFSCFVFKRMDLPFLSQLLVPYTRTNLKEWMLQAISIG